MKPRPAAHPATDEQDDAETDTHGPDALQDETARVLASRGSAQTRRMEREVRDLFLGYALVNFLEPGPVELHWGKYNNRAIDKAHVKSLLDDFRTTDGIDTFRDPFPCLVDEAWVDPNSLAPSLDDHSVIKTVVWTASAHHGRIEVLGGRHRTQALDQYAATLKKKLAAETTKLEKAETKAKGASSNKLDQLRALVSKLEEDVRTTGYMLAALYKRSKTYRNGFHSVGTDFFRNSRLRADAWRIPLDERVEAVPRHDGGRTPLWLGVAGCSQSTGDRGHWRAEIAWLE